MYNPALRKKKNGVPVLRKEQIDDIAECFVSDFCPNALKVPQAIDIDSFIMNYLKLKQDFQYLSHCGIYLGMIVFNNTRKVIVYDPYKDRAEYISAKEGTVIIDNTLLEANQEGRYRFTMAHEGAHWILHRHMFQRDSNQISFFENINEPMIKCRSTSIEGKTKPVEFWDDNDSMEWQANYMSSAILMPKSMIFSLYHDSYLEKTTGEKTGIDEFFLSEVFAENIATIFNVSYQAAKVRLKNLGIIKTEDYNQNSFLKGRNFKNYYNNKIVNNF
ncbi:protein of unknown function [Caloramator quimbayensis]|uniref:IrrE N-terminal-like domain-containing protein n=1 Tax=Caloramator quimbayensis TaxID=1147123 RepID=A0A1T4X4I1_9CLOT|nr:ImmA/IrrE family metallo-endopeptidase [Caloramator quimbayensis]SKA84357.1 protein of unknown function [Caloramator quimbayensis]